MTLTQLFALLDAIWYTVDTEDENKQDCVSRRNVLPLVAIEIPKHVVPSALWQMLCDEAGSCELEEMHYASTLGGMYAAAHAHCVKAKQLTAEAFCNATYVQEHEEVFVTYATQIAIALDINIDDDQVNPEFWTQAFADDLTPLEAAASLLEK
jgi:hypothetical protein